MVMKHFPRLGVLFPALAVVLFSGCGVFFAGNGCETNSGFTKAFFSKASIDHMLQMEGAASIRFYSVRRSYEDDEGTVMAVALDKESKEIHVSDIVYTSFNRLDRDSAEMRFLTADEACQYFFHMLYSDKDGCIVEVPKAEIEKLLAKDMNAILVESVGGGSDPINMRFKGAKVYNGQVSTDNGYHYESEAPCPEECGHYQYFVCTNRRR